MIDALEGFTIHEVHATSLGMRASPMLFLLWVASGFLLSACGKDDVAEEATSCPCACTAVDPVPHCVNTQGCRTTADCPTGTVCGDLPVRLQGSVFPDAVGNDPLAACGSSRPAMRCQIPPGPTGRQALTSGFEVPPFRLQRLSSGGAYAAFTWQPPKETHLVHCALFACPPVVSESFRKERSVFRIENFDPCVMAAEIFEPGQGVFDLGDLSITFQGSEPEPGCGISSARVVHELLVGCWAYDMTKIIGATALEPIHPREAFNFHDQFDLACESDIDGRTCQLSETALGICSQGTCHPPCVTHQDCLGYEELSPEDEDAGADGGDRLVELACKKSGGYVGICMPSMEGGNQ